MPITDTVKTCLYLVVGKWKTFYTQTRISSPIFITDPILNLVPTNTLALHYGLILIQPGSKVTTTSSTATNSIVTTTSSMVTEPKSVVLFTFQVHN